MMISWKYVLTTIAVMACFSSFSQRDNFEGHYDVEMRSNEDVFDNLDSVTKVVVYFDTDEIENFCKSLHNNPQLREVHLINASQKSIDSLATIIGDSIENLWIRDYSDSRLVIPSFPMLSHLLIESDVLFSLDMVKADLDELITLEVTARKLRKLWTKSMYEYLSVIELDAPHLNRFPIEIAPSLMMLSCSCSFNVLPSFLCDCVDLLIVDIRNHKNVNVPPCFEDKIKNGSQSRLTIQDGAEGEVVVDWKSKDWE